MWLNSLITIVMLIEKLLLFKNLRGRLYASVVHVMQFVMEKLRTGEN